MTGSWADTARIAAAQPAAAAARSAPAVLEVLTTSRWQARVTEHRNAALSGSEGTDYLSPPHDLEHARVLVGLLKGSPVDGLGPWRDAVPGGTRLIELISENTEASDA
jgi:hypothetical protein